MTELLVPDDVAGLRSRLLRVQNLVRTVGHEAQTFRDSVGTSLAALGVTAKGLQDFVTVADRRAEETMRQELAGAFPEDGILGEETGGAPSAAGFWAVDPIDGTANYIRGLRHWGVSAAYVADGTVRIGAIFDAANDRVYSATLGGGAFRDGVAIRASAVSDPAETLAIVGYSRRTGFDEYQAMTRRLHEMGVDYRRIGSAAVGLVRVADGIADLYYETPSQLLGCARRRLDCKRSGRGSSYAPAGGTACERRDGHGLRARNGREVCVSAGVRA